ncbi:hypothetical protein L228DRAFT_154247 [Xylona heveae TC161]|uniref:ARM repeat-containing protein n=1 Tax=Xylona heveae (strain CBS 132557 / TC161) TaxID=1328760 RepID=A0A165FX18_XYLHT|nr:hypothetical protein L228DRAFT_154247 [Xylona heveae TC161]KZF21487.1 hypothetical protein L228DRAFT_154247 [Xylona heveae TC161]
MAPTSKPESHLNLSYIPQLSASQPRSGSSTADHSPIEQSTSSMLRPSFLNTNGYPNGGNAGGTVRLGAGSPSHELGGRLYSKRAREIQAQEGLTSNFWGPPTSGNSTPLRENIPESPTGDGFPDLVPLEDPSQSPARRARAGTVPSRFSPGAALGGLNLPSSLLPKTSRPTPASSPFKAASVSPSDPAEVASSRPVAANSALLSRLRAGSMPQRSSYVTPSNPFGSSLFSPWANGRERAATVTSIPSSNDPSSPAQSSRDGLHDADVRTLDYLGLVDTPQQSRATLAKPPMETVLEGQRAAAMQPFLSELTSLNRNANRFRSYSVNAKEKYAEEEEDDLDHIAPYAGHHSGSLTPSAASAAAALAATQAQIHQHNLAVQAFANHASASRPRARTAGVLESPPQRSMRSYLATPSRLEQSITAADLGLTETQEYDDLPEALNGLQLAGGSGSSRNDSGDEVNLEGPTRALWLGSIPSSTTVTSLNAIFAIYGNIESTRVLTHKNCGFVNFEHLESAIQAKSHLNGKEIFPGAGPVRIGYAKVPTSASGTPGPSGAFPSPSPDPLCKGQGENGVPTAGAAVSAMRQVNGSPLGGTAPTPSAPHLRDMQSDMLSIVKEFGATDEDLGRIASSIEEAIAYNEYEGEVPPVPEPSPSRTYDAPRLREIRKRLEHNSYTQTEIEEIAIGMLPEIAELSADYLGNTVVQKLFEYCSEGVKEAMLAKIAPHLAEIGIHKNGTWAAQKIIDVAKTPTQMAMVIESLRPYIVALFLDQFGNYVLQCCLRFGYPRSRYIFETMLSRLMEVSQGRFGARAMRACLESHHATKDQQRMLAAAVALHSVQLASNANGALLLTWFLDTCTFPRRRSVLAPLLVPHLVHLCTHKVAYLTVLKVINQRNEPEARDVILKALFFSPGDQVLTDILRDQTCGPTLIFKVLTTPFFDESMRSEVVQNVRNVLIGIKAQPAQGYKRLMDEVGLSTRGSGSGNREAPSGEAAGSERRRPNSQHSGHGGPASRQMAERQYSGQYFPPMATAYEQPNGLARNGSVDMNAVAYDQFGMGTPTTALYPASAHTPLSPMASQQMQYQQALLAASARGMPAQPFYPSVTPTGLGGYATPPGSSDAFRPIPGPGSPLAAPPQMAASPMMPPAGFSPQPYTPLMGGQMLGGGYQYQYPFIPQQAPQPQQMSHHPGGGRRGRR